MDRHLAAAKSLSSSMLVTAAELAARLNFLFSPCSWPWQEARKQGVVCGEFFLPEEQADS